MCCRSQCRSGTGPLFANNSLSLMTIDRTIMWQTFDIFPLWLYSHTDWEGEKTT